MSANHDLFILCCDDNLRGSNAGEKAVAQQAAARGGLPVPRWFIILPAAFFSGMTSPQREEFNASREPAKVKYAVQRLQVSPRFVEELSEASDTLSESDPYPFFAVRASIAPQADSDSRGGADKLSPILYVRPDDLLGSVTDLWQQAYREELLFSRWESGEKLAIPPPAVIVQRMVHSDMSGNAYGCNPDSGRCGVVVVKAVYGLMTSSLTGESEQDSYEVSRSNQIVSRNVAQKLAMHVLDDEAGSGYVAKAVLTSQQQLPALSDPQCLAVADLTWKAGSLFFRPQEIEWAIEAGKLFLLQVKPLSEISNVPDPDGQERIWDRRGLLREYPGLSTPLTFSVARWMHRGAYQELCRALGVSEEHIRRRSDLFDSLIGYIDGAIYLNATHLREMLLMLPQPRWHRDQLAFSLGLIEVIGDEPIDDADNFLHLDVITAGKMWTTLQARVSSYESARKEFEKRLERAMSEWDIPLDRLRADELNHILRTLQRDLIDSWDAPAMNEALAAIAYDLLGQLTRSWCDDVRGELQQALVMDIEDLPGSDAAHRIAEMATLAGKTPEVAAAFALGSSAALDGLMQDERSSVLRGLIEEYLDLYGEVSSEGLKIEASALRDNPLPLIREIGRLAAAPGGVSATQPSTLLLPTKAVYASDINESERANERVAQLLAGTSMRRLVFSHVLSLARERIRERENYGFTRIRVIGRVREVLVELGRRLYALDVIDSPRHIYYLGLDEVLGFIERNVSTIDLRSLVGLRWKQVKDQETNGSSRAETLTTYGVANIR